MNVSAQFAIGEKYRTASMVYDERWSTFATCEHCMKAQGWLEEQCGGFLHGGVHDDLEDHRFELAFEEPGSKVRLLRLIVGMRRDWQSFSNPNGLMPVPS